MEATTLCGDACAPTMVAPPTSDEVFSPAEGGKQEQEETPALRAFLPTVKMTLNDADDNVIISATHRAVEPAIQHEELLSKTSSSSFDSIRKALSDRLYSHANEEATLLQSYSSLKQARKNAGIVLISGPSGAGKARLARTLKPTVEADGGFFLTGRWDQLQRQEPYPAFVSAITEFTNAVMARGELATRGVRKLIYDAVGEEIYILTSVMPSLSRIMCNGAEETKLAKAGMPDRAVQRFIFLFRVFIRAICSPSAPIVLLLDNLEAADNGSLKVLFSILSDADINGLVVICTCDGSVWPKDSFLAKHLREDQADGATSPQDFLSVFLRGIKHKGNVDVTNISLCTQTHTSLNAQIAQSFGVNCADSEYLSNIVYERTNGNAFHVIEFLGWLYEMDLLFYDNGAKLWKWDKEEIRITLCTDDSRDYLVKKLEQYPDELKYVLKVAACLGCNIDEELLEYGMGMPHGNLLNDAVSRGVLVVDTVSGGYVFAHDEMQKACYRMIPEDGRGQFHVAIGRRLWQRLDREDLDRHIFAILSQIYIGRDHITKEKEKVAIATLCLHAGEKAARSSTFLTASTYLNLGRSLLGERSWQDDYDLTLALHNAAAEMELCSVNYDNMRYIVESVIANARTFHDKIPAYGTRIYALGISDRRTEALALGLDVLAGLGEKLPSRLCTFQLAMEMKRVRKMLKGKSDEQLLRMQNIEDQEKLAALHILQLLFLIALFSKPKLTSFITLRMLRITLKYGMSAFASGAFAAYGMVCISATGDFDEAYRYGELGMKLLDKYEAMEFLPNVYCAFYGVIHSWKKPLQESLEPLLRGYRVGFQTGHFEYASLCANLYCFNGFNAGISLDKITEEWSYFQRKMAFTKMDTQLKMALPVVQTCHHFMGFTKNPLDPIGDIMDLDAAMEEAVASKNQVNVLDIRLTRMHVAFMFNEYELADEMAFQIDEMWLLPPSFCQAYFLAIRGLLALAMARKKRLVRKNLKIARHAIRQFRGWSLHNPRDINDKLFLLEAELYSVRGKNAAAYNKYACAIAMARDAGCVWMCGMASECTARHLFSNGVVEEARIYFVNAIASYNEWGGVAIAKRLQAEVDSKYRQIMV